MNAYTLTRIKTFTGREGYGLNAVIERDGKPVAYVLDDASGGEVRIDFRNPLQTPKSFQSTTADGAATERGLAEAFALAWYATAEEAAKIHDEPSGSDALNCWINEQADAHETKKKLDRVAKKTTLFSVHGDAPDAWRTLVNAPYSEKVQAFLQKKYGASLKRVYNRDGLGAMTAESIDFDARR